MTARTTSLAKTTQKHDFPAAGDIARGWCRLMGPAPLTLFLTTLLVVRNQWILAWHHDGGGEVVAEEQLVLPAQQDVLAAPGRFAVGAVAGPVGREKDSRSVQSTASDVLSSLHSSGTDAPSRSSHTAAGVSGASPCARPNNT
jgi:hypothetical protein